MNSIGKNYLYNSIYQILNIFLPLLTAPYVARVLGAENVGIYSYTYSIANYFVIFAMLGIANYGSRSCARARNSKESLSKTFFSIYALQGTLGGFLAVAYILVAVLGLKNPFFLYQIPMVLSGFLDISWFFSGIEKFKLIVNRNIVVRLASAALVFLFVKKENDLWIYILILSLSTMIGQILLWFEVRKYVFYYRPTFQDVKPHIVPNLTLFIPVIAVNLYKYMDKIMLGAMAMVEQVGLYEYAEKLSLRYPQIPIIVNGEIKDKKSLDYALKCAPHVKGVMIGRAAASQPWIFAKLKGILPEEKLDMLNFALDFISDVEKFQPPEFFQTRLQRFFAYYCQNFSFAGYFKTQMLNAKNNEDARERLFQYFEKCPEDRLKKI